MPRKCVRDVGSLALSSPAETCAGVWGLILRVWVPAHSPNSGEASYDVGYQALDDGDVISLENTEGSVDFTVIHAPGHTSGCMCLYAPSEKIMFTGDVLFACGYGRVDLKYASPRDMASSLKRLYTYKGVKIYPGHGGTASI